VVSVSVYLAFLDKHIKRPVFIITGRCRCQMRNTKPLVTFQSDLHWLPQHPDSQSRRGGHGCQWLSSRQLHAGYRRPGDNPRAHAIPSGRTGGRAEGCMIKCIQQDSSMYNVLLLCNCKPVFEVTGTCDRVEKACCDIESYITLRTITALYSVAPTRLVVPSLSMHLKTASQGTKT